MKQEELFGHCRIIERLYTLYKSAKNDSAKEQRLQDYIAYCQKFREICEGYYQLNLSGAQYYRMLIIERKKINEEIQQGNSR